MSEKEPPKRIRGNPKGTPDSPFGQVVNGSKLTSLGEVNDKPVRKVEKTFPVPGSGLQENGQCAHLWTIESPNGPVSNGICRICGLTREFANGDAFYSKLDSDTEEK